MMSVVHIPTVASLASPCRPLMRPNGRQRQPPTTAPAFHCPAYCDAPPHLRQRSPVAATLKRLLPQRSMSPQVRGHLWPLVSPTTGRQSPKTLHPPTHQRMHTHFFFFFVPTLQCKQRNPGVRVSERVSEFQPKHLQPNTTGFAGVAAPGGQTTKAARWQQINLQNKVIQSSASVVPIARTFLLSQKHKYF